MTEQTALAANETTPAGGIRRGLVASGLLVAALLVLLPVKYVVNDDPGFVMMLSGSDGFPATADVPFVSRILCETLHGLYRLAPAVPWYGIALYLSAWLGLALFLSVPLADRLPRSRAIILLVGWLPYLAFGLYNISMTNITLLLQLGAILHLLFWLRSGRSFRLPTGWIVAGLAVGYLWRWEMFLIFLVFAAPVLLFVERKDLRKWGPVLIGLCLFVTIDRSWEFAVTQTFEHRDYYEFNRTRGHFHDRVEGQRHEGPSEALRKVGWSENDYKAFHDLWMLYDEQSLTRKDLRKFLDVNIRDNDASLFEKISSNALDVWSGNKMYLPPFVLVVLALLLFQTVHWSQAPGGERMRMLIALLLILVGMSAVFYVRFRTRVSFPLLAYLLGVLAIIHCQTSAGVTAKNRGARRGLSICAWLLVAAAVGFSLHWARVDFSSLRTDRQQRRFVQKSVDSLFTDSDKQKPLFIQLNPGVAVMHIGTAPLHEKMTEQPIRVLPSGWNVRSPRYRAALKQLNVQNGQELLRKSVDNPSICFLLYQRPSDSDKDVSDVRNIWVNYFEEHFDEDGEREFQLQKYREIKSGKKGSGRYALIVFRMVSSSR